jgi:RNA polymerase sigma-54 factor
VRVQREFFESKDGAMGSLTMVRVARVVGVHETTISRAISGKYMKTHRGIYPMRAFFEAGYSCADGSTITSAQVKKIITEIVGQEPNGRPATDVEISGELKKRGLNVARRTVAKYREEMGVLSSKERSMLTFRMTRSQEDLIEQPVLAVATA